MVRLLTAFVVIALLATPSLASAAPPAPWDRGESQGEDLEVYLVTFGPGDEVVSWFGHTALVVEDRRLNQRRLYNYGMFSFDEKMLAKYALGRLEFWVEATPYVAETYRAYAGANRDVRLQRLNLTPDRKRALANALSVNVQPDNRNYLYHHYYDNCSTRPRDIVDAAIGQAMHRTGSGSGRMTLRDHTRRYTAVSPPMSLLLDFLMNDEIDKPISRWDEAFLPEELEALAEETKIADESSAVQPLVAERRELFRAKRPHAPAEPPAYVPLLLAIGVGLGFGALGLGHLWWNRRSRLARVLLGLENALVGLVLGVPGTILLLMWLFTVHTVTHRNENLLLVNPLTLAATPLGIMLAFGSDWARRALRVVWVLLAAGGLLAVAIKPIPAFDQDNWRIVALALPISLGMAGAYLLYEWAKLRGTEGTWQTTSQRRRST